MTPGEKDTPSDGVSPPRPGAAVRTAAVLASVPFASTVVAAIALACVVGTVLPQGGDVQKYLAKNPGARGPMELLDFLGLTHVFISWWFIGLLCLLSASLAVCSHRRFMAAKRSAGRARGRAFGSLVTHISLLLILAGGVIRGVWGERGDLAFREGETKDHFVANGKPRHLPFSVHLAKFEVEMYEPQTEELGPRLLAQKLLATWTEKNVTWSVPVELNVEQVLTPKDEPPEPENSFRVKPVRYVPDFVIDMKTREIRTRSEQPNNPAILVEVAHQSHTNKQWLFAFHPDFDMHLTDDSERKLALRYQVKVGGGEQPAVKDFKSTLRILEQSTVVKEKTIEVNSPLSYGGYTFYQSGYNPKDPDWTSLQVVRDPGVPLVYAGFALMILGLTAVFYLYPQKQEGRGNVPTAGEDEKGSEHDEHV